MTKNELFKETLMRKFPQDSFLLIQGEKRKVAYYGIRCVCLESENGDMNFWDYGEGGFEVWKQPPLAPRWIVWNETQNRYAFSKEFQNEYKTREEAQEAIDNYPHVKYDDYIPALLRFPDEYDPNLPFPDEG